MPAHIYLRVSTDEQAEEGYSLQAQERACKLFLELHNHEIAGVYTDDGYSGTSADRPAFARLVAGVQPGDLVVVHKLDRLARNTTLLLKQLDKWERAGVRLVSVTEQIDFSSPIGKVMLSLLAAFAQFYVDNLRQETAKGHREKAQRGLWVGPVPFGYRKLDKGRLVPSEDAPTVQEIYRLYLAGHSYRDIAAELNRRGLTAYNWRDKTRGPWGRENVRVILRNRAYIGKVRAGGVEFDGQHLQLVTPAEWAEAERIRLSGVVQPVGGPKPPTAIAGRLHCARCGRRLWWHYQHSADNTGSFYCRGNARGDCPAGRSRSDLVISQVDDLVELLALSRAELATAIERVYVDSGEIVFLSPTPKYRRLIEQLGYTVRNDSEKQKNAPSPDSEGAF